MGQYANVKRKNIIRLMRWLTRKDDKLIVSIRGKHQYAVEYPFWNQPYPIPFKHNEVNKFIVKDLMELLVVSKICTQEEFDEHVK
jgi:hypothetical protein